jgi:PAS domain S-box-containing protein
MIVEVTTNTGLLFPPEWVRAALVLALMSVWLVVALFVYLNRHTRRGFFRLWTVAWLFYSVYLAASIGLEESPATPFLVMARRACIGTSALFMFWGSFQLTGRKRDLRELGLAVLMMLIWSYLAAYKVREQLWITVPVFALLAAAGVYTGLLYIRHRARHRGANILGTGFVLWGAHLLWFPFVGGSPAWMAVAYIVSAILALLIVVGMVVEQEVTVSEENYRALFDSASDAIFLVDPRTLRILESNRSAQHLTHRSSANLMDMPLVDLCPGLAGAGDEELDAHEVVRRLNKRFAEFQVSGGNGSSVTCEGGANLVNCPRGWVLQVNLRDVTERKLAEKALRQSNRQLQATLSELRRTQQQVIQQERLSALGQMASGIAHDFNNALAKIMGFNELLLSSPEHLADKDKVRQYLQMMNAAAQDAGNVVRRLREFYRPRRDTDVFEPIDLNELIRDAVVLTQPKWKDQSQAGGAPVLIRHEGQPVAPVGGSEADLREVLTNLIFNAVDAMPEGGTITIRTRQDADQVVLEVSDTGTGMTEEVRRRCLEPFFTTKGDAGTGLGLAIVYGIVQRHEGTIQIRSAPGQGTTFVVSLPACKGAQAAAAKPIAESAATPMRVLLAEDEPVLRDIEAEYLCTDGHSVETAADGAEALQKFRSGRYDLVVADRAMPEMNGDQLAAAVKEIAPRTPVILVTGFGDMMQANGERPDGVDLVVSKPVSHNALRQAVRRVSAELASAGG